MITSFCKINFYFETLPFGHLVNLRNLAIRQLTDEMLDSTFAPDHAVASTTEFSALENGGGGGSGSGTGSGLGVSSDQQRLSRQVSLRVRRKRLVRRVAARDTWLDAADKIRVSSRNFRLVIWCFNLMFTLIVAYSDQYWATMGLATNHLKVTIIVFIKRRTSYMWC